MDSDNDNVPTYNGREVSSLMSMLSSLLSGDRQMAFRTDGQGRIILSQDALLRSFGRGGDADEEEEDEAEVIDDDDVDDVEDDGDFDNDLLPRSQHRAPTWHDVVKQPQKPGVELMHSGEFGRIGHKHRLLQGSRNIGRLILDQSARMRPGVYREDYTATLVPNTHGTIVASYDANIYTGQFSADSSFYYTCAQDFKLHVYDMTAPPVPVERPPPGGRRARLAYNDSRTITTLKLRKEIQGYAGRWTITDANLSPDSTRLIYSSIMPTVYMTTVLDDSTRQVSIPFSDPPQRRSSRDMLGMSGSESFGIWTCRFSADGNEIVAGGSGRILVYDLLANRRTVNIPAHKDDVNSCTWADSASGNVLISASDDTFIKVWDRRSLGSSPKPSGVLIGHTEGITYVSAKGDGRYVISNGKDQALRLWDLRKMRSNEEFEAVADRSYGINDFDYRWSRMYPKPRLMAHPQDCSVMTYRGHSVLRTLIRCHFSPTETTGAQYIYSGSADGRIHIWSLDGRVVQVLDRAKTFPMAFDPSGPEPENTSGYSHSTCVRDVSWHSQEPVMMSAAWDDVRGGSTVARHEWKGLSKLPNALEDWVEKQRLENADSSARRSMASPPPRERRVRAAAARYQVPGAYAGELDGDEDDEGDEDYTQ